MKKMNNEKGFTLIEMMIVLLIISVLVLIAIPNVTKHSSSIDRKGCEAFVQMAQGQVEAFKMENHKSPTLEELSQEGYLPEGATCPDGTSISIADGVVVAEGVTDPDNEGG